MFSNIARGNQSPLSRFTSSNVQSEHHQQTFFKFKCPSIDKQKCHNLLVIDMMINGVKNSVRFWEKLCLFVDFFMKLAKSW